MVVLTALLLVARVCCAADTAITLRGRVVDENGLPVGGAQVKLELAGEMRMQLGPHLVTAITDATGVFEIPDLLPGQYALHVAKPEFFVFSKDHLDVNQATPPQEITLFHSEEVRERVEVTAPANQVETTETTQKTTLTATEIRDIPVASSHDLIQSLIALPQVLLDNNALLHIAGSRTTQQQYLLNGFEIGEPVDNALIARFSVDAVRSAEVQTGRFGAEYMHPGAAVLSF